MTTDLTVTHTVRIPYSILSALQKKAAKRTGEGKRVTVSKLINEAIAKAYPELFPKEGKL